MAQVSVSRINKARFNPAVALLLTATAGPEGHG
jgi:hypothetical protein